MPLLSLLAVAVFLLLARQDIRVAAVQNAHDGAVEELPARRAELGVVPAVMVDGDLGEHGQVFHLGLAQGRAVRRDEDHLRLAGAQALEADLVAEVGLARLHDELEPGVHRLDVLLLRSGWRRERMGETTCYVRCATVAAALREAYCWV